MKYALPLCALVLFAPQLAATDSAGPWHATWVLEAVGVGAVLLFALIMWGLRKVAAAFIHVVVLLVAAGLLLLAIFGRSLGLYDAILGTSYAGSDALIQGVRSSSDDAEVERHDPNAPTYEEFFRDNPG